MSERSKHTFQFDAHQIANAAQKRAEYHEGRLEHWTQRRDKALERVKETVSAKVIEQDQTNGKLVNVVVEYGDPEAWGDYQLAWSKANSHKQNAERYRSDERVYRSQRMRNYELDADDVYHFHLDA